MKNTIQCPKCGGSGSIPNPRFVGSAMRELREAHGVSLRSVAKEMDLSAMFISDMERARRTFSKKHQLAFRNAIHKISRNDNSTPAIAKSDGGAKE